MTAKSETSAVADMNLAKMPNWYEQYKAKKTSLPQLLMSVESNDRIWISAALSQPIPFIMGLEQFSHHLHNVTLFGGFLMNPKYKIWNPEYRGRVNYHSMFLGPFEKSLGKDANLSLTSVHLSNEESILNEFCPNKMVIEVSEPDENGYFSLGPCGGLGNKEALKHASQVNVIVNKLQPSVGGKTNRLHISEIDQLVEFTHPIPAFEPSEPGEIEKQIAANVLPLVEDGSTLQIGVGNISNALGYGLIEKKNLGIHTEMLTDSMVHLAKQDVINGVAKAYKPNKIVCSFAMGSQKLLDFCDNNPDIEIDSLGVVNNPYEVAKNNQFMSINSCLMVDLKGQVASEGVGHRQISGTGGQVDFVRAVNMRADATSVIALASTYEGPEGIESTIRLVLPEGTPITTLRSDVQYIATEFGLANLRNQSFEERARRLIAIAHPDFQDQLLAEAKQAGLIR